jgi:hypothetical protein
MKTKMKTEERMAMAYDDAVRDILRSDGIFHLIDGDERPPDAVWQWDGVRWKRLPLDEREEPLGAVVELDDGDAMAVSG